MVFLGPEMFDVRKLLATTKGNVNVRNFKDRKGDGMKMRSVKAIVYDKSIINEALKRLW